MAHSQVHTVVEHDIKTNYVTIKHGCLLTIILIFSASATRGAFFAAVPSKNDSAPTLTNGENLQKVDIIIG